MRHCERIKLRLNISIFFFSAFGYKKHPRLIAPSIRLFLLEMAKISPEVSWGRGQPFPGEGSAFLRVDLFGFGNVGSSEKTT